MLSHGTLIAALSEEVLKSYSAMSRTGEPPPERFVSGYVGLRLHQKTGWIVRIEFPARDCAQWQLDRNILKKLSRNFLIDLVAFDQTAAQKRDVRLLIEFKLWTDRFKIQDDVERLRELSQVIAATQQTPEAYVVSIPHYPDIRTVKKAVDDLGGHFKFDQVSTFNTLADDDRSGAAIIVIDAHNC